ncbi:MAG: hypothetical protein ACXACF_04250 [Candidatus Hermodarchaeia archaeon]
MERNNEKEQWLRKLATEYDGSIPFHNETEILRWLERKAKETKDSSERTLLKELIEEGRDFGSSDDWGHFSTELVSFAKLVEMLKAR